MSQLYLLYESASGYCLFEKEEFDEAGGQLSKIQKSINDIERFSKMVKLAAYQPFKTAEEALENIMAIKDNKIINCNSIKVNQIVDLTGAGDLFAAGFLKEYLDTSKIKKCLEIGSIAASQIIQKIGARLN